MTYGTELYAVTRNQIDCIRFNTKQFQLRIQYFVFNKSS